MPLQMQLSPLWAGLAVYSSKIINEKKKSRNTLPGFLFFWCAEGLAAEELEIRLVEAGHGEFPCAQGLILELQLAVGGVVAVFAVAQNGTADAGHVGADLMGAAGD